MSTSVLLSPSKAASATKSVSCVAVLSPKGMLWGVRSDDGLWTVPGGHGKPSESPEECAWRKTSEEAGIDLAYSELRYVGRGMLGRTWVTCFRADLDYVPVPSSAKDPDHEVREWRWVQLEDGKLPQEMASKLHVPAHRNLLVTLLGLAPASLSKAAGDTFHDQRARATQLGQTARQTDDPAHHRTAALHFRQAADLARTQDRKNDVGFLEGEAGFHESRTLNAPSKPKTGKPKLRKDEDPRDLVVCIPESRRAAVEAEEAEVAKQIAAGMKSPTYWWSVGRLPKEQPCRVYFAWQGAVRAYHDCVGMIQLPNPRLLLDHRIHPVEPEPMQSFRGWRYR